MSFSPVFVGRAEDGTRIRVYKRDESFTDLYVRIGDGELESIIPSGVEIVTWSEGDHFFIQVIQKPTAPKAPWVGKAKGTRYDLISEDVIDTRTKTDEKARNPLFCECNDFDCFRGLPIDETEHTALHKKYPGAAVVMPGHEDDGDVVLERHETYLVVREAK